jgi:hypothetical protein
MYMSVCKLFDKHLLLWMLSHARKTLLFTCQNFQELINAPVGTGPPRAERKG